MNKAEWSAAILIGLGLLIMGVAYIDGISIVADILNKLWNASFNVVFLSSFVFRCMVIFIGGSILLCGGFILKTYHLNVDEE